MPYIGLSEFFAFVATTGVRVATVAFILAVLAFVSVQEEKLWAVKP